ncbi:AAA family ATPase [Mycobacterium sp.]|uniref:helix-turn-helix transcriptional regulator n=1 Tax=Mycobacterium sp. TaxID=1785 RepID=UPI0025CCBD46|nr:AAA family ATPase [Mycobacterium sp.]MBW0014865.1 AAA family ATPase [Mycobacterium sp.]
MCDCWDSVASFVDGTVKTRRSEGRPAGRLLEREAVLAELATLARGIHRGEGRVVLLRGEAGVGKTAAITRFAGGLDAPVRVLVGGCDPLAAPRPLGPLLDALAGLGPAADAVESAIDAGDTAALYRRLLAVLRDGNRWVWVIEDAHWADGATLDLVRFLARRIGSLPLLLVVSYRDDELDAQHPLAVALGDVATCAAVSRIALQPLSRDAVAVLAAGSGVNTEQLHQLTGGNPFYVTEVLAAGPDALRRNALPRSVSEAVWGRLGRLSAIARQTAQAVAVCGPRADPALVRALCSAADAGLAECLDAGVLVAEGQAIGFRHELARRATLDRIDDYQRKVLHSRALSALAESMVDPNTLAALALHADGAGDREAAVRHGVAAAQRAAALGAHRQAADLYALVLRHADTAPAEQKVVWLEQHALTSYLGGLVQACVHSYREAIALRRQLGDHLEEGDDLRRLSHVLSRASSARKAGRESLRLLEQYGPTPQLAWSLAHMAELSFLAYDPACADYAARAITLGNQLNLPAVVIKAGYYAALSAVVRTGVGWDELEAAWHEAMGTAELAELAGLMGMGLCWQAALRHELDRAEGYIAETTAFCAGHDLGTFEPLAVSAAALVALHRGDWARAATRAENVLSRPAMTPLHRYLPLTTLGLIRARRGQQPVSALLDEAISVAEPDDFSRLGPVWAARAEAAWLAGDDITSRTEAQAGLATAPAHADPWLVGALRRWAYLAGGQPDDTGERTPFELELRGDWRGAAAEWTRRGCPYDSAVAQLGGDAVAVESALATFRRLGATAAARRSRQRLTALRGATPRSRPADVRADPDGLSRRQREVLTLITAGHSDADIATKLCISPKTVGHHVQAILAKLGVANRTQAAAEARQSHTAEP